MRLRTFLLAATILATCPRGGAQSLPLSDVVSFQPISSDLAETLAQAAWRAHLPMIAELAQPLPRIEVSEGTYVVKDLMQGIIRQAPEYKWESDGKIIHVYNTKLREARFNFLNLKFARFITPPNVSEFELTFPTLENGLLQGTSGGTAISGFGDPSLEKDRLQPAVLENVTGRQILSRVANESPSFLTIIVFPNDNPTEKQMKRDMNRNWFWQALGGQHSAHLQVEPSVSDPQ